jgi:hypothetical protein
MRVKRVNYSYAHLSKVNGVGFCTQKQVLRAAIGY